MRDGGIAKGKWRPEVKEKEGRGSEVSVHRSYRERIILVGESIMEATRCLPLKCCPITLTK